MDSGKRDEQEMAQRQAEQEEVDAEVNAANREVVTEALHESIQQALDILEEVMITAHDTFRVSTHGTLDEATDLLKQALEYKEA